MTRWSADLTQADIDRINARNRASRIHVSDSNGNIIKQETDESRAKRSSESLDFRGSSVLQDDSDAGLYHEPQEPRNQGVLPSMRGVYEERGKGLHGAGVPAVDSPALSRGGGVSITLPWPPSVNHYWMQAKNGHRYIGPDGLKFRSEVRMRAHGMPMVRGGVSVEIVAHPPDKRRRDIDNLLKSAIDALQHAGLIEDDSNVEFLTIRRSDRIKGGAVQVEIRRA